MKQILLWSGLFALSMGYFEAVLVEYLRELYYPQGFTFPLVDIPPRILLIEIVREAASIVMLLSVAVLMRPRFIDRFAGFAYCFGIWDITYYLFLKLFEGWPPSLLTEDILFLIPLPWVGPVWAPVGVSIALIWSAVMIWKRSERGITVQPNWREWLLEIFAGLIIITSFIWRVPAVIHKEPLPAYAWYLWLIGMTLGLGIFYNVLRRTDKIESS